MNKYFGLFLYLTMIILLSSCNVIYKDRLIGEWLLINEKNENPVIFEFSKDNKVYINGEYVDDWEYDDGVIKLSEQRFVCEFERKDEASYLTLEEKYEKKVLLSFKKEKEHFGLGMISWNWWNTCAVILVLIFIIFFN